MYNLDKYNYILKNEKYLLLKNHIAHGNTSTYEHCIRVAQISIKIAKLLKLLISIDNLIVSALLHDFYLYDWHKKGAVSGLHGYTHPKIAADNAKNIFKINDEVYKNIYTHMWPLTITKIPKTKEGILLCVADKISSIKEIFV